MSGDDESPARPPLLSAAIERALDRQVGRLAGEPGRAVSIAHGVAIIALTITFAYIAFFLTYDARTFAPLVAVNLGAASVYGLCVLLAHLGRQLGTALALLGTAITQLILASYFLGWQGGMHLYMLLSAQLVFLVFTENQRLLRWVWALAALFGFLACQFLLPASAAQLQLPQVVLTALFSLNALLTASMLFIMAAVSHFRGERARSRAAELAAHAEHLANTDVLTGLFNRRPVIERLEQISVEGGPRYSLAIADLDRFKEINDEFGHQCGDHVLADIGGRFKQGLRATDAVGRWGGEEFIFVIDDAELPDAVATMERVRVSVEREPVTCGDHEHSLTVSIGVTEGQYDGRPHHVIRRADSALYASKAGGRNLVSAVAAPIGPHLPSVDPAPTVVEGPGGTT